MEICRVAIDTAAGLNDTPSQKSRLKELGLKTPRAVPAHQRTHGRQKAPEIAPLFNAFQRAGPRPENSFLYLLGHIDLASIRASSAPWLQPRSRAGGDES